LVPHQLGNGNPSDNSPIRRVKNIQIAMEPLLSSEKKTTSGKKKHPKKLPRPGTRGKGGILSQPAVKYL